MLILKLVGKILLLPVWLILFVIWLPVHLAVYLCSICHGFGKLFFGFFGILALCFGMWQNAIAFGLVILATFLVVFAGTVVDVLLEEVRHGVGRLILA